MARLLGLPRLVGLVGLTGLVRLLGLLSGGAIGGRGRGVGARTGVAGRLLGILRLSISLRLLRALASRTGSERHVEVERLGPELSGLAGRRLIYLCGRRGVDDRLGADGFFALTGAGGCLGVGDLRLHRIGAVRLLILRVLGRLLTHSNNATGVTSRPTARRPPTPHRVFPRGSDRPHPPTPSATEHPGDG